MLQNRSSQKRRAGLTEAERRKRSQWATEGQLRNKMLETIAQREAGLEVPATAGNDDIVRFRYSRLNRVCIRRTGTQNVPRLLQSRRLLGTHELVSHARSQLEGGARYVKPIVNLHGVQSLPEQSQVCQRSFQPKYQFCFYRRLKMQHSLWHCPMVCRNIFQATI